MISTVENMFGSSIPDLKLLDYWTMIFRITPFLHSAIQLCSIQKPFSIALSQNKFRIVRNFYEIRSRKLESK